MYFERITASIEDIGTVAKKLLTALTRPLWIDPNTSRVKADIGTCTTVTTVTTVTGITNIGGMDAKQAMLYAIDRQNWNQGVRTRIS